MIQPVIKHSLDEYTIEIDYTDRLPTAATVSAVAAAAIDLLDGSSASSILGTPAYTSTTARIPVEGGVDGSRYLITATVTLSNGNILADQLEIIVRDR